MPLDYQWLSTRLVPARLARETPQMLVSSRYTTPHSATLAPSAGAQARCTDRDKHARRRPNLDGVSCLLLVDASPGETRLCEATFARVAVHSSTTVPSRSKLNSESSHSSDSISPACLTTVPAAGIGKFSSAKPVPLLTNSNSKKGSHTPLII